MHQHPFLTRPARLHCAAPLRGSIARLHCAAPLRGSFAQLPNEAVHDSLAVLLLDVACNVHEEGDGQQQGFHDVGHIEVAAGIHLGPLRVIVVELQVAIESHLRKLHVFGPGPA